MSFTKIDNSSFFIANTGTYISVSKYNIYTVITRTDTVTISFP
jgi:hypothetical protein